MILELRSMAVESSLNTERKSITEWLSAPSSSSKYLNALRDRQAGTGHWYIRGEVFQQWIDQRGSFSWLYGIPGSGKTVLSSTSIEDLTNKFWTTPDTAVAYFYFAFDDYEFQSVGGMLRSLIAQLSLQSNALPGPIKAVYKNCSNGQTQMSFAMSQDLLHDLVDEHDRVFIVLDALDECTERHCLISTLELIAQWQKHQLNLLATSRKEPEIHQCFEGIAKEVNRICIQGASVEHDINSYVRSRIQADNRMERWRKAGLQSEIETALSSKADGMYVLQALPPYIPIIMPDPLTRIQVSMGRLSTRYCGKVSKCSRA